MKKKYEFVGSDTWCGKKICRIRALRSFGNVIKGEYAGWVEGERNLSHEGNCWISSDGAICGDTKITGDLIISQNFDVLYTVSNPEKLKMYGFPRTGWHINYSGFDKKTNQHFIRVGCQVHSINKWKNPEFRENFVLDYRLSDFEVNYLLGILSEIEKNHCQTDPFKKIEENIAELKKEVTEPLKTETISLISSLPITQKSSLPKRDKFGRFIKNS